MWRKLYLKKQRLNTVDIIVYNMNQRGADGNRTRQLFMRICSEFKTQNRYYEEKKGDICE